LKEIQEAEAALAQQREAIERIERKLMQRRKDAQEKSERIKRQKAEEAMFDRFRQAVGADLWDRAKAAGADCLITQRKVGYNRYEPRLRIDRRYSFRGPVNTDRPRDYKLDGDFKKAIEYLGWIASSTEANAQRMDSEEQYISGMGLKEALGITVRRKTNRRGRLATGYEFILEKLPEHQMRQVVDLLNSFKGDA
jgi:hypothetical protein